MTALLAVSAAASMMVGTAASAPATGTDGAGVVAGPATTVTLITGDRVVLDADGKVRTVRPAAGREHMSFTTRTVEEQTWVVPADARMMLARGELDRRLFDVSELVESGYDDERRDDLPVIVTHADAGGERTVAAAAGADVADRLPSASSTAVEVERDEASAFWDDITDHDGSDDDGDDNGRADGTAARTLAPGIEKVWLDGVVRASLDTSVPQIGAPTAWDAGLDGSGTTIAILDTGIDDTHPDLTGRVAAARNFSDARDTVDRFGHGTHVASIAAGNGERYRGVAPGAQLLNGKVLDDEGWGNESDIVAAMQWAVDQGADVVNLSLGGEDTPDVDPVEQAIEYLSEQTGTLFVVAAGNFGPYAHSVDSPGSAPSALTVGAVDKRDVIAEFSARGAAADGSLKPDVTAPGVEITAARAVQSEGSGSYIAYDGTSMATPHVAGAAAILAQQHPDWDGEQIKAVLAASATPGEVSSYAQGAGRVDVARAVEQTVTTTPAAVDFGIHEYPHEQEPATQELTYRNAGDEPVELDLSVSAYGLDGKPAPEGMFTLDTTEVTVPAGGEAGVTVTVDTRVEGPHGVIGGTVTAADAETDTTVSTAVGVWKQAPWYDLTLTFLDPDGRPTTEAAADLIGLDSELWEFAFPEEHGSTTLRVPEGTYNLTGDYFGGGGERYTLLLNPMFDLTGDTEIVLDARKAEPFDISMPNSDAEPAWSFYSYTVETETTSLEVFTPFFTGPNDIAIADLGPVLSDDQLSAELLGVWNTGASSDSPPSNDSPEWYHAGWRGTGTLLAGMRQAPSRNDFAVIDSVVGHTSERMGGAITGWMHEDAYSYWTFPWDLELPAEAENLVLGDGFLWSFGATQFEEDGGYDGDTLVQSVPREYSAGETLERTYNVGVFGPTLSKPHPLSEPGAFRWGEHVWAMVPTFGDGSGNPGYSRYNDARSTLRFNGDEIAAIDGPLDGFFEEVYLGPAPTDAGRFELSTDVSRPREVSTVSNRVQVTWGFDAEASSEEDIQELPLSVVRFTPELSPRSTTPAGEELRVPFVVEGAGEGNVEELTVDVSFDEGGTWQPVEIVDGERFVVDHPDEPGSVSLRVNLTDGDGNTLEQVIERAYLTVKPEPEPTEPPEPTPTPTLEPTPTPEPSPTPEPEPTSEPQPTEPPGAPPKLPDTGADAWWWALAGMALIVGGAATLAAGGRDRGKRHTVRS
ncbi:S8 family serine peptidase [Phytoactinopolyspora halotolerans]|uniref:S8 family serine peptidase n=1 Tax=Phytoactinopolyspora halotolerans TaxID=1981512 RepID=A0A6L9SH01_9ACTN|nr:S8 family serine peptidase [Phytoactinopolyspora halotolerans]NEE04665.1 S8 family serine peptidase [Phytoactinopolyspora halotolerans]